MFLAIQQFCHYSKRQKIQLLSSTKGKIKNKNNCYQRSQWSPIQIPVSCRAERHTRSAKKKKPNQLNSSRIRNLQNGIDQGNENRSESRTTITWEGMNATTATTKNEVLRKGGEEENLVVVFGGNDEGVEGWRVDGHERPQSLKDVSHLFASSPLLSSLLCNPSKIEGPKKAITAHISQRRHHTVGSTLFIWYTLIWQRRKPSRLIFATA